MGTKPQTEDSSGSAKSVLDFPALCSVALCIAPAQLKFFGPFRHCILGILSLFDGQDFHS
jgi:hypothetical protein